MPRSDALAEWLASRRWFATKTKRIVSLETIDHVALGGAVLTILAASLDDGTRDHYAVPLSTGAEIVDALDHGPYAASLYALIARGEHVRGAHGEIVGIPTHACPTALDDVEARRLGGEQSNTSVVLGDAIILKHFRRLAVGRNPEEEVTRFLTERTTFAHAPRLFGHAEYRREDGAVCTLAVAQELIRGVEDGWAWTLDELRRILSEPIREGALLATAEISLRAIERLGEVTAELHVALASDASDPAFAPEPIAPADVARWSSAVRARLDEARAALEGVALPDVPDVAAGLSSLLGLTKIRHHGDYHLGQTLYRPASGDWFLIDFEGEPIRPIEERREKHAALRDVAGMLRSLDYAAVAAGNDHRARVWEQAASERFLDGYRPVTRGERFVPDAETLFARAVAAFVVEKAAYEIVYEANHRPSWIHIPLDGLTRARALAASGPEAGAA
jgi:maltose alpha-D-glucosyltransferase / alpha-amylase